MPKIFKNRIEAGDELSNALEKYSFEKARVYGLPRGGVIVANRISKKFGWPLDVIIVRKISHKYDPEFALGAVTESGEVYLSKYDANFENYDWLQAEIKLKTELAKERRKLYGPKMQISNDEIAIIVDDGAATGYSLIAAMHEIKNMTPRKIFVAIPVLSSQVAKIIKKEVDELFALDIPKIFSGAVSSYYEDFPEVTDSEVMGTLNR